jgi:hypothetical protein
MQWTEVLDTHYELTMGFVNKLEGANILKLCLNGDED